MKLLRIIFTIEQSNFDNEKRYFIDFLSSFYRKCTEQKQNLNIVLSFSKKILNVKLNL